MKKWPSPTPNLTADRSASEVRVPKHASWKRLPVGRGECESRSVARIVALLLREVRDIDDLLGALEHG
jgi:hypothetical protein